MGEQVKAVADTLQTQFPVVADMLDEVGPDVTAYAVFAEAHWRKIWSTNPSERPTTNGRSPAAATFRSRP